MLRFILVLALTVVYFLGTPTVGLVMTRKLYESFGTRRKHFICAIIRKSVLKDDKGFKKKYELTCTCVHYTRHIVLTTRTCYMALEYNRW